MNPSAGNEGPLYEPDEHATYSLEIVAKITGVDAATILLYQEEGLLAHAGEGEIFDDEAVHTLRRIEHLRQRFEANLSGVRLMLALMDEVERLKNSLRAAR
ncbi:MAG: chaperone modulator CbpM [Verrucomicrobiota bacterium]